MIAMEAVFTKLHHYRVVLLSIFIFLGIRSLSMAYLLFVTVSILKYHQSCPPTSHLLVTTILLPDCFICIYMYIYVYIHTHKGASLVAQTANICLQCRRPRFYPWVRKIPWRKVCVLHFFQLEVFYLWFLNQQLIVNPGAYHMKLFCDYCYFGVS